MLLCFSFLLLTSSLKPIYLVIGYGESSIYSRISNSDLYPECPSFLDSIIIQNNKKFNTNFLSRYPKCAAKLLRVQFNTSTKTIDQLPGIKTESTYLNDTSILSDTFGSILNKIKRLGYQDNIDLFSVGYNYFFHPISSFLVYEKLKKKIEEVYTRTGQKSIIICSGQDSSFSSIFLSNYSQTEWIKHYIDSVIFLSPTFAGSPSLSNLITQKIPPFVSNSEFKKSFMRLPGFHISLPNYVIFENFTINSKLNKKFSNKKVTQTFELLKDLRKFDDESEVIFKECIEKYLKVPIPEPPVPSIIMYDEKTAKTAINSIISIEGEERNEEAIMISARYACTHWKSVKCIESNEPSQSIFEYINSRTLKSTIRPREEEDVTLDLYVTSLGVEGVYANDGYVTSHTFNRSEITYSGPEGQPNLPLSNAFDGKRNTYYISSIENSDTYNNTLEITFSKNISLEAFLYDTAYKTSSYIRTFLGFPTLLYAYTKSGNNPYSLSAIFRGNPVYPWSRIQFVFPKYYLCDSLKLEFVEVTNQTVNGATSMGLHPAIGDLIFIRHLHISSEDYLKRIGYLNAHVIDPSDFTYTASESLTNYIINNAFDDDDTTYYISKNEGNNYIEITFKKTEKIQGFLNSIVKTNVDNTVTFQGLPTKMNVYASLGNNPYEIVSAFEGSVKEDWDFAFYHLHEITECDKLKIEFVEVTPQTIEGSSVCPVISNLRLIRFLKEIEYTTPNFNRSSDGYLIECSINPSKFTYEGTEGYTGYPLSNAFDSNPSTFYISNTVINETNVAGITINFDEAVSIEYIVYVLAYGTSNNYRTYQGYPTSLNIYASLGGKQLTPRYSIKGVPISPTKMIEFHFKEILQCDRIRIEFGEASDQTITSTSVASKRIVIANLYFVPANTVVDGYPIEPASNLYMNDTYVRSICVNESEFTIKANPGFTGYEIPKMFDFLMNTYYISSVQNNITYNESFELDFNEAIYLEGFLMDTYQITSGNIRTYRGFPTGLKVYSSIDNEPFSLFAFYFGNPVYPWTRIQYVFPEFLLCDKLKLEFTHVNQQIIGRSKFDSISIANLILLHAQIPATPTESPTSSPSYSPTSSPSHSSTPSPTASFMPTEIPITDVCHEGSHCKYEGSSEHHVMVTINTTVFSSIQSNENGGAILIQNAGMVCTNISFRGCQTRSDGGNNNGNDGGGGGGLYIKNEIEIKNEITLTSVSFTNCKANYGGAIYIYSSYYESKVSISSCFFSNNQATSTSDNNRNKNNQLIGGSAIFISSKSSVISECIFDKNIGEGQLKIQNRFTNNDNASKLNLLDNQPKTSNVIKSCRFIISRQSKSSIYYMSGENGVSSTVRNSNFVGDLFTGNYHINGMTTSKFSPKLIVVACKFSSDYSRSFNTNNGDDYINAVYQKQTFNYEEEKDDDSKKNLIFEIAVGVVVGILVIVIVFVVKKRAEIANLGNAIHN